MISSGEIYHMSFRIRGEFVNKRIQAPIIEIREELKKLNAQDVPKDEMERRVIETMTAKYGKKA